MSATSAPVGARAWERTFTGGSESSYYSPGWTGGSRRPFFCMPSPLSVAVHHLDLLRFAVLPDEANPIRVVDPDAVLPAADAHTGGAGCAREHTTVWTGRYMIVWGGIGTGSYLNTGGQYTP